MAGKPIFARITDELRRRIALGIYPADSRLPGRTALASEFGVSVITSNRALNELVMEKLVERRERRGTYVCARKRALRRASILIPMGADQSDSQAHSYMRGCVQKAERSSFALDIHHVKNVLRADPTALHKLLGDGVIHVGPTSRDISIILENIYQPLVIVGVEQKSQRFCVAENRQRCACDLVETMIRDGYRRIGFIGKLSARNHRRCRDGYLEAISPLSLGQRFIRDADEETIQSAARDLLSDDLNLDSVVIAGGQLPIAALPVIMSVRPSVRMACFHEAPTALHLKSIAYVGYYSQVETGSLAISLLDDIIAGRATEPTVRHPEHTVIRPGPKAF